MVLECGPEEGVGVPEGMRRVQACLSMGQKDERKEETKTIWG
jgi:hypothetical protein